MQTYKVEKVVKDMTQEEKDQEAIEILKILEHRDPIGYAKYLKSLDDRINEQMKEHPSELELINRLIKTTADNF